MPRKPKPSRDAELRRKIEMALLMHDDVALGRLLAEAGKPLNMTQVARIIPSSTWKDAA